MAYSVEFVLDLVREVYPKACRIRARSRHHKDWWRIAVNRHFGHFSVAVDLKVLSGEEMVVTRTQLTRRRFIPNSLEEKPGKAGEELSQALRFMAWCWGKKITRIKP